MENNELNNKQRLTLVNHFKGKEMTDILVKNFCTKNNIPLIDTGSIEDFIYQKDYDDRMKVILPLILKEISNYKFSAEYDSEEDKKKILELNDSISEKIALILANNGVLFREIDSIKMFSSDIQMILINASGLASRKCTNVIAEIAQEKLGDPLTIKSLYEEERQIADRKFKKIKENK